ncbi:MAG TPA: tRNA (adenosine(37)-N6)-threonylcarbamoyltransferase complex dimerization subunit type 1 TsaB [Pirellulales bacterium]|nr:tRNA (adenosine(37)-N6)-threonylcarbamoyltransferase complex dimerization subunit type 1 TsaB [Pirellulales bacterium]
MHILALETSGTSGGVAVLDDGNVLAEVRLDPAQRSAKLLAPAIKRLIEQVAWRPADVELVAVAVGPGSFTGLRVGVTTAKTFAYAVGAEVLAVNTLEVIAAQATTAGHGELIAAAIDAQRGDVYTATFRRRAPLGLEIVVPVSIRRADEWIAGLSAGTLATGPALEKLLPRLPADVAVAAGELWFPQANMVGRLAAAKHAAGQRDDLWRLAPLYLRASAAEEKAARQGERVI